MTVKKKIAVSVILVTAAFIIAAAIITTMFYPRRISCYLKINIDKVNEIYFEYYEAGDMETSYLDREAYLGFVNELKNVKTVRKYYACKCEPIIGAYVLTDNKIYNITEYWFSQKDINGGDVSVIYYSDNGKLNEIFNKYK